MGSTTTGRFALTRATLEDMPEIAAVSWESFDDWVRLHFMGSPNKEDVPRLAKMFTTKMQTDPTDIWVKVTENATGKIVSAGNWKLHVGPRSATPRTLHEPPPGLEGDALKTSRETITAMSESRNKANQGPFLYLHIMFTLQEYRRRGAASMVMKWGCDLADSLFMPAWIEASPEGNYLYKVFGFEDVEVHEKNGKVQYIDMRRSAKSTPVYGGK